MQSTIQGTKVEFTGPINERCSHFLVVKAVVTSMQSTPSRSFMKLHIDNETRVFPMPSPDVTSLGRIVEVCAGLGCLGQGMKNAGFQTVLRVDWSKPISELAHHLDGIPSCVADIAADSTLVDICEIGKETGTLAAGVSCQPYSRLGDQKQQHDIRAETLPQTLRIAHLTRKQIVILECVEGAMHCKWFQQILHQFAKETGFKIQQGLLHLQQVWPARRTRWWCLLMHPSLGQIQLQQLPSFDPHPTLSCLIEKFLCIIDDKERAQLELDTYELGKWGIKGLSTNEINLCKQMATSLHSCANHLIACPCGCRAHPMSDTRLQKDGMHGLLVPLNDMVKAHDVIYPTMRHIHPDELSLFNGVQPGQKWGSNLKLALCALGQLASPIQSGWIASQVMSHLHNINLIKNEPASPLQTLKIILQDLIKARDGVFGVQTHRQAKEFEAAIDQITNPVVHPALQIKDNRDDQIAERSQHGEHLTVTPHAQDHSKQREGVGFSQEPLDELDQAILAENTHRPSHQAFAIGAVPGFEVQKRRASGDETSAKRQCHQPTILTTQPTCFITTDDPPMEEQAIVKGGGPCPRDRWCPNSGSVAVSEVGGEDSQMVEGDAVLHDGYELVPSSPTRDHPATFEVVDIHVCTCEGALISIVAPCGTTVEQLLQAENKLHSRCQDHAVTDAMGVQIQIHSQLHQNQFVMLSEELDNDIPSNESPPVLHHNKRDMLLWQQKGWVALDEMSFYIKQISTTHNTQSREPLNAPMNPSWEIAVCHHLLSMATTVAEQHEMVCISALLKDGHWDPIIVWKTGDDIQVQTTSNLGAHLQDWCQENLQALIKFVHTDIANQFQADCGFQTVRCLETLIKGDAPMTPMSSHEAAVLRGSFHCYLEDHNLAETQVVRPLILGGMTKDEQALQQLLQDHGVSPMRSQACTEHVMKVLGQQTVHQVLMSPRPWADLKARASMQTPPIRLVLAEELQQMIQTRTKQGGPVGRKNNKAKATPQEGQMKFKLTSDQVIVPKAVFVQSDGIELQQVSPQDLKPGCQGVMVANIEDAIPFFGLTAPVSQEGIGLLILDFTDERIPECRSIIKVPVLCKQTNEPMLITAALVQIGGKEIKRNTPASCPAVQEIDNQVFRILVFKDQYPHDWEEFVKAPVRQLMNQDPLINISQQIVDVWDRQFLSEKMNKVQPNEAYLFAVSIRIHKTVGADLAKASGVDGKYAEPRIHTGRQPDPNYQVIWLPRKTFREATLAKQTSPVPCTLVRTADRYGLRAEHSQAEELHKLHRPDQMFLQGTEVKRFKVGPMPYGANKQSLANIFKTWQWNARPVGPFGQSRSRDGVMWVVQAVDTPQSWVYQLAHGDVLITPEDIATPAVTTQPMPVLASNKTIQSLRQPSSKSDQKQEDPWLQHDPWQRGTTTFTKEASVHQIAAVQARLEAVVEQKIRDHIPDATMEGVQDGKSEAKVAALEHQIQSLTTSFQSYQQQQANQNQMVQRQVQALDAKVDSQQSSIQQMLDSKLDDQMQRIEHLLSKRQRSQE